MDEDKKILFLDKVDAFIEAINTVGRADHTLPEPYASLCMDKDLTESSIWNLLAGWSYHPCGKIKTEERKKRIREVLKL